MESSGGSGGRAIGLCDDRLVAAPISEGRVDVRGERSKADFVQSFSPVWGLGECEESLTSFGLSSDGRGESLLKLDHGSDGEFLGGFEEAFECSRFDFCDEEGFGMSSGWFVTVDPEGIDPGVIHDEQIARFKDFGDVAELTVENVA